MYGIRLLGIPFGFSPILPDGPSPELDAEFVKAAAARDLVNLKGHRVVGGIRASIYNAMPIEGVQALVSFMKDFETEHK